MLSLSFGLHLSTQMGSGNAVMKLHLLIISNSAFEAFVIKILERINDNKLFRASV